MPTNTHTRARPSEGQDMNRHFKCAKCGHNLESGTQEDFNYLTIFSALEKRPVRNTELPDLIAKYADHTGTVDFNTLLDPTLYYHNKSECRCPQCNQMNYLFLEVYLTPAGIESDSIVTEHQILRDELAVGLDVTNQRLLPFILKNLRRPKLPINREYLMPQRITPCIHKYLNLNNREYPSMSVLLCNEATWNAQIYTLIEWIHTLYARPYSKETHQIQFSFNTNYHKQLITSKEKVLWKKNRYTRERMVKLIDFLEHSEDTDSDYLIFIRSERIEQEQENPLRDAIWHVIQNIIAIVYSQSDCSPISRTEIIEIADVITTEVYSQIANNVV